MSSVTHSLPDGFDYRLATAHDNELILAFLAENAMQAGMQIRFDRQPDYFALHSAHSPDTETWLLLNCDKLIGMASLIFRQAYVDSVVEPIAYLSDLRVALDRRVAGLCCKLIEDRLLRLNNEAFVRFAYCAIIRDNHLARNTLLRSNAFDDLNFQHLRGYSNVSIVARKPWQQKDSHLVVRRAALEDVTALREFLDRESSMQCFGVIFDEVTWRHRVETWPGLKLEDFHLACDADGRVVGCVAPWDYSRLKKIVIDSLPPAARALQVVYNAAAPLTGKPKFRGGQLPDIVLSHLQIRDRDPAVFLALLNSVYKTVSDTRKYATISLCLYDDDPLWSVLKGYWHFAVPMDLYSVVIGQGTPFPPAASAQLPGFEICLV